MDNQFGRSLAVGRLGESEQQPERIAVSRDRTQADGPLPPEAIHEELLQPIACFKSV